MLLSLEKLAVLSIAKTKVNTLPLYVVVPTTGLSAPLAKPTSALTPNNARSPISGIITEPSQTLQTSPVFERLRTVEYEACRDQLRLEQEADARERPFGCRRQARTSDRAGR